MEQEKIALVNELIRGKNLTKQLKRNLKHSSSKAIQKVLVENILSSCGKAISMLQANPSLLRENKLKINAMESSCFIANGSTPTSEHSNQSHKGVCKKRKDMHCRTQKVKVLPGNNSLEGALDDGHRWRKYGQKDIFGANFPREYFRCTNRVSHGCLATKLVQRLCEDPTIIEITYKGQHVCLPNSNMAAPAMTSTSQCLKQEQDNPSNSEAILNFQRVGLKTEREILTSIPSFSFSFSGNKDVENGKASTNFVVENKFMESISLSFGSPATSGSTYFSSLSACHMDHSFELSQYTSEMISGPIFSFPVEDSDCLLVSPDLF